ncbi:MAG: site-specific DNA-methyltransferase [Eggerthia catenaformis]|uniref:site-specific DNA-methyltransferase n=1 Tax=Eggerthia catenaformis TaxID=31973 RepID=UPI003FA16089
MEKMRMESINMTSENIEKIGSLFPNCVTESLDEHGNLKKSINFEILKQMLSDDVVEGDESYEFTWVGKKASIVEANKPIRKTLRPCKEESVNWDTTENLYIEGDNLEVLKLLQESYLNKVKMIYIDPPYNTGNDFIYNDDFKMTNEEYENESGKLDTDGNRMFKNTDSSGRFHSDWCSMIYSRILLARNLLSDDGVIFISIDDNEVDNLRKCCDEVFGNQNFIAHIIHKNNSMKNQSKYIGVSTEFILVYAKDLLSLNKKQGSWRTKKKGAADINAIFKKMKDKGLSLDVIREEIMEMYSRPKYAHLSRWNKIDEYGVFMDSDLSRANGPKNFTIYNPDTNQPCRIPNRGWGKSKEELERLQKEHLIWYGDDTTPPRMKSYLSEESESVFDNFIFADTASDKKMIDKMFGSAVFEFPKSIEMMKQLILLCTKEDDIVLDFFSGSATTAHAVMQLNAEDGGTRKFIMVQLPEKTDEKSEARKSGYDNICEIGKERIRRAAKKILEDNPEVTFDDGFRVFKLDDSNMNDVYYAAGDYSQDLLTTMESNVKSDRIDLDLLFGCLLEWGLSLSMPYSSENISGCTVHTYNEGDLIACFDENVPDDVIKKIANRHPLRAVFRDSSFVNSPSKINVGEIFKLLSPDTRIKVI